MFELFESSLGGFEFRLGERTLARLDLRELEPLLKRFERGVGGGGAARARSEEVELQDEEQRHGKPEEHQRPAISFAHGGH